MLRGEAIEVRSTEVCGVYKATSRFESYVFTLKTGMTDRVV